MAINCLRCKAKIDKSPDMSARHSYCVNCWSTHLRRLRSTLYGLAGFTVAGILLILTSRDSTSGWLLLNLVLLYLFGSIATIFHEFGHALTAGLVGARVQGVIIGAGPQFWQTRLFGIPVVFRAFALGGGYTLVTHPSFSWVRLRQAVLVLAGPVTNLAIALALIWLLPATALIGFPKDTGLFPMLAFIGANLVSFVASLIPMRYTIEGGVIKSDGLQLLCLPFQNPRDFSPAVGAYFFTLSAEYLAAKDYNAAREAGLKGLRAHDKPDQLRAYLSNQVAWCNLLLGKAELLQEAIGYASEATELAPDNLGIKGTLGSVLIEDGQYERGLAILLESTDDVEQDTDKALNMCYVAIAYHYLGDANKGRETIRTVEALDPDCLFLGRAHEAQSRAVRSSLA